MTPHELAAVHQHDQTGSLPIVSRALIEAEARCKRLEEALRRIKYTCDIHEAEGLSCCYVVGFVEAAAENALRGPGGSE